MDDMTAASPPSEWRNGSPVLLTAFVGIFWMSLLTYPTGVLLKPIEEAWGWSRGETTLLISFHAGMTLLLGPWAGSIARRYGIYRTAFFGVLGSALGLLGIAASGPHLALWYAAWIVFGFAQMFCTVIVWSYAVSLAFKRRRGFALAIAMAGSALAAFVFPPLTLGLYERFGIAGAYIGFAVLVLATSLPLMALTRRNFQGIQSAADAGAARRIGIRDSLSNALRTRTFWLLGAGMATVAGAVSGMILHYHALMTDRGMSVEQATWVMSLLGPALLVGRLTTGWLLDRLSARQIVLLVFFFPAMACAILATFNGSLVLAVAAVFFIGLAAGAEGDMLAYFTSRYFGVQHYAPIYGLLLGMFSVGYGSFPPIIGFMFDSLGSYSLAFAGAGVALILGAALLFLLGDYPPETDEALA